MGCPTVCCLLPDTVGPIFQEPTAPCFPPNGILSSRQRIFSSTQISDRLLPFQFPAVYLPSKEATSQTIWQPPPQNPPNSNAQSSAPQMDTPTRTPSSSSTAGATTPNTSPALWPSPRPPPTRLYSSTFPRCDGSSRLPNCGSPRDLPKSKG